MKKYIVVALLVLCVGCSTPTSPEDDMWTQNLYPATNNTYDIGSPTLQYQDGYFVNLHIGNSSSLGNISLGGGNFTSINVLSGGQVRAWDAANVHSVWLSHDGTNGVLRTDFNCLYLYSPTSVVNHLGDSAGVSELQVENSGNARVAAIDSAGNIDAIGNVTATGNATASYFIGDGSYLTGITQGELILYFLNSSSPDVAGERRLSSNYNSSTVVLTGAGLSSGNTLMGTWITDAGVPSKNLIDGNMRVHVTGRQTAGTKVAQYYFEVWKCNSSGGEINKITTSEYSLPLTAVNATYRIWALTDEVGLNTSDRIKIKGYAYVTGGGSAPTIEAQIQGPTFTRLVIPVGAVSVEKFVPYTGAVSDLTYGGATLRLDGSFAPASIADVSAVNNSLYFSTDSNTLCYKNASGSVFSLY